MHLKKVEEIEQIMELATHRAPTYHSPPHDPQDPPIPRQIQIQKKNKTSSTKLSKMKHFSVKFLDIMVGLILGLGFQSWPLLQEPWQYVAFVFSYFDITDYWIDYSSSLKKFPPRKEINVILDMGIMFSLFLYIFATQRTLIYFLLAFLFFRILDYWWLVSARRYWKPTHTDKLFFDAWIRSDLVEGAVAGIGAILLYFYALPALPTLIIFIAFRILVRIWASFQYKKIHFI